MVELSRGESLGGDNEGDSGGDGPERRRALCAHYSDVSDIQCAVIAVTWYVHALGLSNLLSTSTSTPSFTSTC
jgi:hypothetical protein